MVNSLSTKILSGIPYTPKLIDCLPLLSNAIVLKGFPNFSKKLSAFFFLSLKLTPIIIKFFSSLSFKRAGISALQGEHHDAQKFIKV